MAQIFPVSMNAVARGTLFGAVFIAAFAGYAYYELQASDYITNVAVAREQPVEFSHEHHVRGLGIDCRYCHTTAETSSFAGIPATHTCMTCHSQIWNTSPMLKPVRDSWATNRSLPWTRVHNLPEYAYFDHSVHVNKGVGCSTCHGEVDRMPLTWKANTLQMGWCLECHRNPEKFLRPVEEIYNMRWKAPANQLELGRQLVEKYHVKTEQMTNCSVCHR